MVEQVPPLVQVPILPACFHVLPFVPELFHLAQELVTLSVQGTGQLQDFLLLGNLSSWMHVLQMLLSGHLVALHQQ